MQRWQTAMVLLLVATAATAQFQPVTSDFEDLEVREDIEPAGNLEGVQRVLRFVQVSDAHILDDDAPAPMRVDRLDTVFAQSGVSDGGGRPQEEYTDEVLNRAIAAINGLHMQDELDFVINTGDNIDNELENELMRFIDNWEGTHTTTGPVSGLTCQPDGQSEDFEDSENDVTDACTSLPPLVAQDNVALAPGLPWFSAFGNHDGLIQGNVPIEPSFQDLAAEFGRHFLEQDDYVAMHFQAGQSCEGNSPGGSTLDDFGHGYGFAKGRLCDDNPDNDGYYAFDLAGMRFIVLDTVNDDFVTTNEELQGLFTPQAVAGYDVVGGYAEGAIDADQFAWLQGQLDANNDRLIVLMSHHTINSMFTNPTADACCGPDGESLEDLLSEAGFKTGKDLAVLLADTPQVIAWIGGHTHQHRIEAKNVGAGTSPGFWNIESSSLIDMPQEFRTMEVWVTEDGNKGFLALRSSTHDFALSKELALTDDQANPDAAGAATDQDVMLWFDVPAGVTLSPQPSLPRYLLMAMVEPQVMNGSHGMVGESVTLSWKITDSLLGAPVPGLDLEVEVFHADPQDYQNIIDDLDVSITSENGTYTTNFTPVHGATHYVSVRATDPDGLFEGTEQGASLVILDPDATQAESKKEKSPGLGVAILVALGLAALVRRR